METLDEAIKIYREARSLAPTDGPLYLDILKKLGDALIQRFEEAQTPADVDEAVAILKDCRKLGSPALTLWQRLSARVPILRKFRKLGSPDDIQLAMALLYRSDARGDRQNAADAADLFATALPMRVNDLLDLPPSDFLFQRQSVERLFRCAVEAHVKTGRFREAMVLAEQAKSRLLSLFLARTAVPSPGGIPANLRQSEESLVLRLAILDRQLLASSGQESQSAGPAHLERLRLRKGLMNQLGSLWKEIETYGPDASFYVAARRGEGPRWKDLEGLARQLGPGTALLSLFDTGKRTVLFLLRAGENQPRVFSAPLDWGDFIEEFNNFLEFLRKNQALKAGEEMRRWWTCLDPILSQAESSLKDVETVVIAPFAHGHLIPWAALLAERIGLQAAVVIVPALSILNHTRSSVTSRGKRALVVGNPATRLTNLPSAEKEAWEVARKFSVSPLIGRDATQEAVLRGLRDADLAHFATHAYFAETSPLNSGIYLAEDTDAENGDGILSVNDILSHGLRVPFFTVLSACETGLGNSLGGDEMVGLIQAFLFAGARSLIVSHWQVDDESTAFLMGVFYREWRENGNNPAVSLKKAMDATRAAKKEWQHPYFWGAFSLVGEWR